MLPDLCLRKVLTKMWEAVERYFLTASLRDKRRLFSYTSSVGVHAVPAPTPVSPPSPVSFHLGPPSPPQMENRKYRHFQGY